MVDTLGRQEHERPPEHLAHLGVVCPRCNFRQFVEVEFDQHNLSAPQVQEIRSQLEAWMASRCPEHLRPTIEKSKN